MTPYAGLVIYTSVLLLPSLLLRFIIQLRSATVVFLWVLQFVGDSFVLLLPYFFGWAACRDVL